MKKSMSQKEVGFCRPSSSVNQTLEHLLRKIRILARPALKCRSCHINVTLECCFCNINVPATSTRGCAGSQILQSLQTSSTKLCSVDGSCIEASLRHRGLRGMTLQPPIGCPSRNLQAATQNSCLPHHCPLSRTLSAVLHTEGLQLQLPMDALREHLDAEECPATHL